MCVSSSTPNLKRVKRLQQPIGGSYSCPYKDDLHTCTTPEDLARLQQLHADFHLRLCISLSMKPGPGDAEARLGGFADGGQDRGDAGGLRDHAAGDKPEEPRGGQRLGPKSRRAQVLKRVCCVLRFFFFHVLVGSYGNLNSSVGFCSNQPDVVETEEANTRKNFNFSEKDTTTVSRSKRPTEEQTQQALARSTKHGK